MRKLINLRKFNYFYSFSHKRLTSIKLNIFYHLTKEKTFFKSETKIINHDCMATTGDVISSSRIVQEQSIKKSNNKIITKKESFFQYVFVQSIINRSKTNTIKKKKYYLTELNDNLKEKQFFSKANFYSKEIKINQISDKLNLSDYLDDFSNPNNNKLHLRDSSKINYNFLKESILPQDKIFINYKKPFLSYWLLPFLGLIGLVPNLSVSIMKPSNLNLSLNNTFNNQSQGIINNNSVKNNSLSLTNKNFSNNYYFQINNQKNFSQSKSLTENQFLKYKKIMDELFLASVKINKKKSQIKEVKLNFNFSNFSLAILNKNLKQSSKNQNRFNWYWSNLNKYLNKNLIFSKKLLIQSDFENSIENIFPTKLFPTGASKKFILTSKNDKSTLIPGGLGAWIPQRGKGTDHAGAFPPLGDPGTIYQEITNYTNLFTPTPFPTLAQGRDVVPFHRNELGKTRNYVKSDTQSKTLPQRYELLSELKKSNSNLIKDLNLIVTPIWSNNFRYISEPTNTEGNRESMQAQQCSQISQQYFIGVINDKISAATSPLVSDIYLKLEAGYPCPRAANKDLKKVVLQDEFLNTKDKTTPYKSIKKAFLLMDEIIFNGPALQPEIVPFKGPAYYPFGVEGSALPYPKGGSELEPYMVNSKNIVTTKKNENSTFISDSQNAGTLINRNPIVSFIMNDIKVGLTLYAGVENNIENNLFNIDNFNIKAIKNNQFLEKIIHIIFKNKNKNNEFSSKEILNSTGIIGTDYTGTIITKATPPTQRAGLLTPRGGTAGTPSLWGRRVSPFITDDINGSARPNLMEHYDSSVFIQNNNKPTNIFCNKDILYTSIFEGLKDSLNKILKNKDFDNEKDIRTIFVNETVPAVLFKLNKLQNGNRKIIEKIGLFSLRQQFSSEINLVKKNKVKNPIFRPFYFSLKNNYQVLNGLKLNHPIQGGSRIFQNKECPPFREWWPGPYPKGKEDPPLSGDISQSSRNKKNSKDFFVFLRGVPAGSVPSMQSPHFIGGDIIYPWTDPNIQGMAIASNISTDLNVEPTTLPIQNNYSNFNIKKKSFESNCPPLKKERLQGVNELHAGPRSLTPPWGGVPPKGSMEGKGYKKILSSTSISKISEFNIKNFGNQNSFSSLNKYINFLSTQIKKNLTPYKLRLTYFSELNINFKSSSKMLNHLRLKEKNSSENASPLGVSHALRVGGLGKGWFMKTMQAEKIFLSYLSKVKKPSKSNFELSKKSYDNKVKLTNSLKEKSKLLLKKNIYASKSFDYKNNLIKKKTVGLTIKRTATVSPWVSIADPDDGIKTSTIPTPFILKNKISLPILDSNENVLSGFKNSPCNKKIYENTLNTSNNRIFLSKQINFLKLNQETLTKPITSRINSFKSEIGLLDQPASITGAYPSGYGGLLGTDLEGTINNNLLEKNLNRTFLSSKKNFKIKSFKDQKNKITLSKKLIDLLSKKQTLKIKRRLKKMKKETRRRKKRKIFYPRPKWLTFSLYRNFLNQRYQFGEAPQNLKYEIFHSRYPSTGIVGIDNVGAGTIKKSSWKPMFSSLKKQLKLNEGQTKNFYRTSSTVFFDLKRILMKSNWLRNYLNPYFEKVKDIFREIQISSKKIEIYSRIKDFLLNFYGFEKTISKNSFYTMQNYSENKNITNNLYHSKIQNNFNINEYNRIIYQRFQRIIFSIKDNLNLNGDIKNRSKKLGKNIRPFIKRDYKSNSLSTNQPINTNQNSSFWSKFFKNTILKINTYTSYGYNGLSQKNTILNVSKNNLFWALNKTNTSASGTIENFYSFQKKLWENYKNREISKSNKTKKIIYNFFNKYGLNDLGGSNRSKSLEGLNHILEKKYKDTIQNINRINQDLISPNGGLPERGIQALERPVQLLLPSENISPLISLNNYINKSEQKLMTIENKLKLLGLYSKKIEKTYKNSYFRSLKQELFNSSYISYTNNQLLSEMDVKKTLNFYNKKNNINSFSTLNNYHKISNNYSYWWVSSPLDINYLSNILPVFNDSESSNLVLTEQKLKKEPITRGVSFIKLELFSSEIIFSLLFHFCTLVSFISLGGIRTLIKFYYILISKISKLMTQISFIELFRPSIFLNNFNKNNKNFKIDGGGSPAKRNAAVQVKTLLENNFSPQSPVLLPGYPSPSLDPLGRERGAPFLFEGGPRAIKINSLKDCDSGKLSQLRLLFYQYIMGRNQSNKLKNYQNNLNQGWTIKNIKKYKFLDSSEIVDEIPAWSISTMQKAILLKHNLKGFSHTLKGSPRSLFVLNKYKFNLNSLFLFKTSTLFYTFYKTKFYIHFFLLKSIDLFALPISFIYKFFEKPGEYVVENLAYNFLVEWSSDLITTIPDTFDMNSYSYLSKFKRNITPLILFYNTFGFIFSSYLNDNKKKIYFDSFIWTVPFAITNSIVKRLLNSLLLVFIQQLYEPDLDSLIREKKGIIFWDLWGEYLKQIAEENSINIYELTTDKEEQIKLLSKYEDVLYQNQGMISNYAFQPSPAGGKGPLHALHAHPKGKGGHGRDAMEASLIYRTSFFKSSKDTKKFQDNTVSKKIKSLKLLIKSPFFNFSNQSKNEELSIFEMNKVESEWSVPRSFEKERMPPRKGQVFVPLQGYPKVSFLIKENSLINLISSNIENKIKGSNYTKSDFGWAASQFLSYQGKDTDLFIDLHPPKSFWSIPSIKYSYSIQQPIGSIVCQIFSGIFYKQISKNILVVGSASSEKSTLIQAMAGETELKMITDNANRYAMVYRGVAVGIKLLRDVFEALSVHTPCIFLMEDIHIIGERRPFLIDEASSNDDSAYNKNQSMQGILLKEKSSGADGTREVLYRNIKHLLSHYKKPYKEPKSLATNHFSFTFLFSNIPGRKEIKTRNNFFKPGSAALPIQVIKKENESKYKITNSNINHNNQNNYFFGSLDPFHFFSEDKNLNGDNFSVAIESDGIHKKIKYSSALELKTDKSQSLSPPTSSPFNVLVLKEEKKLKHKKLIKEIPWFGLPGEQFSLISKYNYSTRIKIALLADLILSNLSVKLDMITDLLVIIDSVKGNRGFVVFATTHIPSILDPALRRPGRFDETINLPIISTLFSRWSNYRYNIKFLSSYLYQKSDYSFIAPLASTFSKGVTIDLFKSNLIIYDKNILNYSNELINYINKKNSIFNKKLELKDYLSPLKRNGTPMPPIEDNIQKIQATYPFGVEGSASKQILGEIKNQLISNKQFLKLKAKNYSFACKSLISLLLFSSNSSLKWISILKDSNIFIEDYSLYLTMFANPLILKIVLMSMIGGKVGESFVLHSLKRENSSSLKSKNVIMKNINEQIGFKEKLQGSRPFTPFRGFALHRKGTRAGIPKGEAQGRDGSMEVPIPINTIYKIENEFLFDFDNTWRQASSLLLSYLQKRQCSILTKNIALCGYSKGINKLLSFNNKYSLMEPPSPPITNILLPAKRYENYKKTFNNQYETNITNKQNSFNGSLLEKLQFHQQQRLLRRLYKYPIKEFFKSEVLTQSNKLFEENNLNLKNKNQKQSNFNSSYLTLAPLEKINNSKHLITLNKISSTNWCYKNILYNRHRTYLTNQWWNGQQGEHNAESTFLSDIDWRYTFIQSIGDINMDFPDAEQFYNPRNRRWFIDNQGNKNQWDYWFNIEYDFKDIYSHYIYESFTKVFKILNQNREIIDFYAEMLHQIPSTPNSSTETGLNERELLNIYKRFYGTNSF